MFIPVLLRYRKKAEKRNVFRPYFGGIMTLHEQNHEIFISPDATSPSTFSHSQTARNHARNADRIRNPDAVTLASVFRPTSRARH